MKWNDVKATYPNEWVVFEAIQAHSEDNERIIDEIAVIDRFNDSMEALNRHAELHKQHATREYYFFHTSRDELKIKEQRWAGIRSL
jgi:hypothetical protein